MSNDVIRALVVDDEPAAREAVTCMLIGNHDVQVAGVATNAREAIERIRELKPDLLFLDIEMPDGNGFDVLSAVAGDLPRGVVFVTAHDEYAVRAFEVHALDYVLKPFGKPRFDAAVARAIERLRMLSATSLQSTIAAIQRIAVKTGSRTVLVDVDKIRWIEACDDYVRVHTAEQSHLVHERMSVLEKSLDTRHFVRIHRSCIVRVECVEEMHRESDGGGTIVVSGGVRLRVARARWSVLDSALAAAKR